MPRFTQLLAMTHTSCHRERSDAIQETLNSLFYFGFLFQVFGFVLAVPIVKKNNSCADGNIEGLFRATHGDLYVGVGERENLILNPRNLIPKYEYPVFCGDVLSV